jgi:hypothetical protein
VLFLNFENSSFDGIWRLYSRTDLNFYGPTDMDPNTEVIKRGLFSGNVPIRESSSIRTVVRRRKSVKQCMLIYIMQMELKSIKKQRLVFES